MHAAESCMPSKLVRGSVMNSKECSKCKVVKSVNEFHKHKGREDGLQQACNECRLEQNRKYRQANKEKITKKAKQYRQDNKERERGRRRKKYPIIREQHNEREKNKKANDPVYALKCNVSSTIAMALKRNAGSKQGESVMKYLPYTIEQLKEHLENQFEPWMTWENRSEWHIDHIYPQSKLPYASMDEPNFQKCWSLENLQPLESSENISKGNKV